MMPPRFTIEDVEGAHRAWGCNCGPAAVAAIGGLTLEDVRKLLVDWRGYLNPTQMIGLIERAGFRFRISSLADNVRSLPLPNYGLAGIQWEGPWTEPGAPPKWRYRYRHWIAAQLVTADDWRVFDINAIQHGGIVGETIWRDAIVPKITREIPRASGAWHVCNRIEINRVRRSA